MTFPRGVADLTEAVAACTQDVLDMREACESGHVEIRLVKWHMRQVVACLEVVQRGHSKKFERSDTRSSH